MDSCKGKAVINHGPEDLVFSPREFLEVLKQPAQIIRNLG